MHLQYPPPAALAQLDDAGFARLVRQSTTCVLNEGELCAVLDLVRMDGVPLEHALEEVGEQCRRRARREKKRPRTARAASHGNSPMTTIEAARTGLCVRASPPCTAATIEPSTPEEVKPTLRPAPRRVVSTIDAARTGLCVRASPPPRAAATIEPLTPEKDQPATLLPEPAAREEGPLALAVLDVPALSAQLLELLLCRDLGRLCGACARLASHAARETRSGPRALHGGGYACGGVPTPPPPPDTAPRRTSP